MDSRVAVALALVASLASCDFAPVVLPLTRGDLFPPVFLLLVLLASLSGRRWGPVRLRPEPVFALLVLALALIEQGPYLGSPFTIDAQTLRVGAAATDVFADWNHPFLPYLLMRPVTWFTLEPWALRLPALLAGVAETLLLAAAAWRSGGWLAAALAAGWFLSQAPHRADVLLLADWDLAGLFLAAQLLWTQRAERDPWPLPAWRWLLLAALMTLGVWSSYLMIVPAGVVVGAALVERWRRGNGWLGPLLVGLVFVPLAAHVLGVFHGGMAAVALSGQHDLRELLTGMANDYLVGPSAWMLPPVLLGLAWLFRGVNRWSNRMVLGTVLAVPVAVMVAWRWSAVNGGYYVQLATCLVVYAAAVATARALAWVGRKVDGWAPPTLATRWVGIAVVAVVALVPTRFPGHPPPRTGGGDGIRQFDLSTRGQADPIVSSDSELAAEMAWTRVAAGEAGPETLVATGQPADLAARVHRLDERACLVDGATRPPAGPFWLVRLRSDVDLDPRCLPVATRCAPMPLRSESHEFLACGPEVPAAPAGGADSDPDPTGR